MIYIRLDFLKNICNKNEKIVLESQCNKLMNNDQMGEIFKVLYITKKNLEPTYPFTDDVGDWDF